MRWDGMGSYLVIQAGRGCSKRGWLVDRPDVWKEAEEEGEDVEEEEGQNVSVAEMDPGERIG